MFNRNILFLLFICINLCNAHEKITLFQSDIAIQSHGTIIVQETIEIISEHKEILHGIVREFPTQYRDTLGSYHAATFRLVSITHNQQSATYSVKKNHTGCTVYIGDKNIIIPQGKHKYVITYEMTGRLSFFENQDEFYWNITGNQWRLPIEKIRVCIHLPDNNNENFITTKTFTTYNGTRRNNNYNALQDKIITIEPSYSLRPRESLTILVKFPKVCFVESTSHQRTPQPLDTDTLSLAVIALFLCYFIMCIIFLIFAWFKNKPNNIIPMHYPPQNMTPSEVGFIMNRSFSKQLLIADIIDLAHHKLITISTCTTTKQYTLALQKSINLDDSCTLNSYYEKLLTTLFKKHKSIVIAAKHLPKTKKALKICEDHASKHNNLFYTLINFNKTGFRIIIALFITLALYALYITNNFIADNSIIHVIPMMCLITFWPCIFISMFSLYTHKGKQKQNEIYGFKLYLMNASVNSRYHLQSYPMKTIELYEKYLPYAIALGVEKQWIKQFAHILDTAEKKHESSSIKLQYFSLYLLNDFMKTFSEISTIKYNSGGDGSGDSGGDNGGGGDGGGDGGW